MEILLCFYSQHRAKNHGWFRLPGPCCTNQSNKPLYSQCRSLVPQENIGYTVKFLLNTVKEKKRARRGKKKVKVEETKEERGRERGRESESVYHNVCKNCHTTT